ncbi:hypothetical protein RHMOL_Rhmol01G0374000 [Rhododendron molle]|uniref:Uncharacterized protein n=1 Tax=Rhododendron molle TaxID=49168 RepID=A0ACC0QAC2_RHOML|nr:hypothetical protein RHMOL_Rhmol01G0374000 [Rhododendron molle]
MNFFKFQNLNPIYKTLLSRFHTQGSNTSFHLHPHNRIIQALGSSQFYDHYPFDLPTHSPNYRIPKRWHVGHSHHHRRRDESGKEAENIFRLGLAADFGLAAGKALTGYLSGSTAIIADAAHSASDVVLSGVALLSFKVARVPKDKEHPYGHGKFETLGALGISVMLLGTAGGIAWHALDILVVGSVLFLPIMKQYDDPIVIHDSLIPFFSVIAMYQGLLSAPPEVVSQSLGHEHMHSHHHGGHHHGIDMDHPILALSMTIIAISVKEGLFWITKRAGEREGSGLMKANAWHHRADAVSSFVTLIGVGGSILGVKFLDPLAGIIVSGMILKAGLETGYQSILELVDAAVPSQQLDLYKQTILQVEGVKGCNHLRGRRAGSSLHLDVNIEVDPFSSVSAAHDVGESVRHHIQKLHHEVAEVFIHIVLFVDPAISLVSESVTDQQVNTTETNWQSRNLSSDLKDIEDIVSNILSSKFSEKLVLQRTTHHLLGDKILLQIEVSMPPDMSIRDAIKVAEEAEREILKAASDAVQVFILLRLGHTIPEYSSLSH